MSKDTEALERIAVLETKVSLLQRIVFGAVSVILFAFMTALVAYVWPALHR